MKLQRFLIFIVLTCLLIGCSKQNNDTVHLSIIQTTDLHGSLFPYDFIEKEELKGSLGALTGYLDELRYEKNTEIILLDNGDILQGDPSVYYYNYIDTSKKHPVSEIYNFINFDAVTVGNHDIEPGHAVYDKIREDLNMPLLAANAIHIESGDPYFEPYTIIKRKGVKIAVLGLITPAIPNWLPPDVYSEMRFEDMVVSAEKWVTQIKKEEKPDLLIGLFHSGLGSMENLHEGENAVMQTAQKVDGFDIIFYGHDHRQHLETINNDTGNAVMLINPGANGKKAAFVELTMLNNGQNYEIESLGGQFVNLENYNPTKQFSDKFNHYKREVQQYVDDTLSYLNQTISTRDALFGPSAWMQLTHEVQMQYTHADLSFSAPLSFDRQIDKGYLTVGELFQYYRYRNLLYLIELSGQEIKDYLEYSYSNWFNTMQSKEDHLLNFKTDSAGNPIVSKSSDRYRLKGVYYNFDSAFGIDYTVDITKPAGQRISIQSFSNGKPFLLNKKYQVAINSYRANGGGGHLIKGAGLSKKELSKRVQKIFDGDLRLLIQQEIEKKDTVNLQKQNNWKVVPADWWQKTKTRDSLLLFNSDK
jgi:2',3'-cyclic-nucleotide 2'-phosphodiesterase/3'-nucleotidase